VTAAQPRNTQAAVQAAVVAIVDNPFFSHATSFRYAVEGGSFKIFL
jgi:hypothetical protein